MCQTAYRIDTAEEIGSMGDIRRLVGPVNIVWNSVVGSSDERAEAEGLPDENCLCWVSLPSTLVGAGFKVWQDPDVLPEYLCEAIHPHAHQSSPPRP